MASSFQTTINLGLPATPDIEDKKYYIEFTRIYNAINAVARAIDTYTGSIEEDIAYWNQVGISDIRLQNISRIYPIFDDTVLPGAMINLYNVSGIIHARLAKAADATKPARGFSVASVTSGLNGEIALIGANNHLTGLTPGELYYLSATSTSGQIVSAAPSSAGNLIQPVGFALSSTTLYFNPTLEGKIV